MPVIYRCYVQPNMHRCLRIPEIRTEIFGLLRKGDCAALARTCKLFYNEAMDVLWADLQSLLPLVRCMPPDLVDDRIEVQGRNPMSRAWEYRVDVVSTFCIGFIWEVYAYSS